MMDAPRRWWPFLVKNLLAVGFVQASLDVCVFIYYNSHGAIAAIVGWHMDDGIGGHDKSEGAKVMHLLKQRVKFGVWRYAEVKFAGKWLKQLPHGDVEVRRSPTQTVLPCRPFLVGVQRRRQPNLRHWRLPSSRVATAHWFGCPRRLVQTCRQALR